MCSEQHRSRAHECQTWAPGAALSRRLGARPIGARLIRFCFLLFTAFNILSQILSCAEPVSTTPLGQDAYLWQRRWTPEVRDAVSSHAPAFSRLALLVAEQTWEPAALTEIHPDAAALGRAPVVASIRVAAGPAAFERPSPLPALAARTVSRLRAEGLNVVEVQLDLDAASSQLAAYARLAREVRAALPVPLTLTALPDWLSRPELPALLDETDGWTLQLHDFTPPRSPEDLPPLLDPVEARAAITRAAALGRPFRIALPTYAYTAAFTPEGAFIGASAEREPAWAPDVITREISADPGALAGLMAGLLRTRPPELLGVTWFRLPVATDAHAWRWPTLEAVMAGRIPSPALSAQATPDASGLLVELSLRDEGDADAPLPDLVVEGAPALAADGYADWRPTPDGQRWTARPGATIRAGETRPVGWIRLGAPARIQVRIEE